MLKQRLAAGAVLAPLFLWLPWGGGESLLPAVVTVLAAIAAWEWSNLGGLVGVFRRTLYSALVVAVLVLGWWSILAVGPSSLVLVLVLLAWSAALFWLVAYALGRSQRRCPICVLALGLPAVGGAFYAFMVFHLGGSFGPYWITQTLVLVWGCDIGGYLFGRAFGRHKLAARVSPGKTWEGAAGGLILGVVSGLAAHLGLRPLGVAPVLGAWWLLAAGVVIVISIAGDLVESMFKRHCGIKDSGRLIPGHGGVLDRLDAVLIAAPCMAALVLAV